MEKELWEGESRKNGGREWGMDIDTILYACMKFSK